MKILCLFSKYPQGDGNSNISKDLVSALSDQGHDLTVATILEKKYGNQTTCQVESKIQVLRIKTGNMFDTVSRVEKLLTVLSLPFLFIKAIKKNLGCKSYDLIISHTPFMSDHKLIGYLKRRYDCKSLLLLWDIFPQNALDLGMIKKGRFYSRLLKKQRLMFESFDFINCMSEGNRKYLLNNFSYIQEDQLMVNHNWGTSKDESFRDSLTIRSKYGFNKADKIAVFGGNLGKPQQIQNIIDLAVAVKHRYDIKILVVGKGTEFDLFSNLVTQHELNNITISKFIPRQEYRSLLAACNVGLVSLDRRFTVPNFPSKATDYFALSLPVFAILDTVSANDFGDWLVNDVKAGQYILSDNLVNSASVLVEMLDDTESLNQYAINGSNYFRDQLQTSNIAKSISDQIHSEA